jgi:hypothetical protein
MLSALIRLTCLSLLQSRVGVRPNSDLSSHILVGHPRRSREANVAGEQYLAIATYLAIEHYSWSPKDRIFGLMQAGRPERVD